MIRTNTGFRRSKSPTRETNLMRIIGKTFGHYLPDWKHDRRAVVFKISQ
jgi:hypothetical protein